MKITTRDVEGNFDTNSFSRNQSVFLSQQYTSGCRVCYRPCGLYFAHQAKVGDDIFIGKKWCKVVEVTR